MISIATDGFWCPVQVNVLPALGGAPAPCPVAPSVIGLVPVVATAQEIVPDPIGIVNLTGAPDAVQVTAIKPKDPSIEELTPKIVTRDEDEDC